jgi:hypothetical protein
MIKDRLLLAALSGFIAALMANLTLYLFNLLLPGQNINMPQVTVEIFLNINEYTPVHNILGVIWSTIVGGTYALLYLVALDLTGWNNLWIKSIFVISGAWLLLAGFAMRIMNLAVAVRNEPASILAFFVAHLFFATYLYLMVKYCGKA